MFQKLADIRYIIKDFIHILKGVDYFHQPQPLGQYFKDGRSYYNDLRGKANWTGKYINSIPALYIPSKGRYRFFPIMIFQYGLGNIDMYFHSGDKKFLRPVQQVFDWIINNINSEYFFDNLFSELNNHEYHSSNSAMAQGEVLSFLIRTQKSHLVRTRKVNVCQMLDGIFSNMIKPLENNGTVIKRKNEIYFCEICRKNHYIVLNGWIYAIFGLYDYWMYTKNLLANTYLKSTLQTLKENLKTFELNDGWSYYDNKKRLASPFYQNLHISLFQALWKLTGEKKFKQFFYEAQQSYTTKNKIKHTLIKIKDKLFDREAYATQ